MPSHCDKACQALLQLKLFTTVYHGSWIPDNPVQVLFLPVDHDHVGPFAIEQLSQVQLDLLDEFISRGRGHDCIDGLQGEIFTIQFLLSCDIDVIVRNHVCKKLLEHRPVAWLEIDVEVFVTGFLIIGYVLSYPVDQDQHMSSTILAHTFSNWYYHVVVKAFDAQTIPHLPSIVSFFIQVINTDKPIFLQCLTEQSCPMQWYIYHLTVFHPY